MSRWDGRSPSFKTDVCLLLAIQHPVHRWKGVCAAWTVCCLVRHHRRETPRAMSAIPATAVATPATIGVVSGLSLSLRLTRWPIRQSEKGGEQRNSSPTLLISLSFLLLHYSKESRTPTAGDRAWHKTWLPEWGGVCSQVGKFAGSATVSNSPSSLRDPICIARLPQTSADCTQKSRRLLQTSFGGRPRGSQFRSRRPRPGPSVQGE